MNFDIHIAFEVGAAVFSGIAAVQNMRMRLQIDKLKWWIVRNFQARPDAKFFDDELTK